MQELQRVWGSPENMERRKRANQLADKYGLSAIQIALTYVVQQSFPAFAIIGPRTPSQLFESVKACNVKLSEAELAWLDLRGDLNEY
jgi:aryl-alcohol dehydrogenase-like predicted oxidoreductase